MINVPARYQRQSRKFASLLSSLYLPQTEQSLNARIDAMVEALRMPEDTLGAETGLEAIGRLSLRDLRPALNDPDELVRLRAARCMLNIGYDNAIKTLMDIAKDQSSTRRVDAINAIGYAEVEPKLLSPLRVLLSDENFEVSLLAFEILQRNRDLTILRQIAMSGFSIQSVVSTGPRRIHISREKYSQIILFGTDIKLKKPLFLKDENCGITINATADDDQIMLMRQDSATAAVIGPIYSNFSIGDMLAKLTDNTRSASGKRIGLGLDYSGVTSVLKELADSGAITAELYMGGMSEIRQPVAPGQQAGNTTTLPETNKTN